jgi:DNA-binding CsgD family transcriptional regulator
MKIFHIILWIAAYSLCLFHIMVWRASRRQARLKVESRFLAILINVVVVTGLIMVFSRTAGSEKRFTLLLGNCLLSFFITVPRFVYAVHGASKTYYLLVPAALIAAALVYNVCILAGRDVIAFSAAPVFFALLFMPVFLKKPAAAPKKRDTGGLGATGAAMVIVALCFAAAAPALRRFAGSVPYAQSACFALFTLAYQVPGLLYCKKHLFNRLRRADLSVLSKREQAVAAEICGGLTYAEIAEKLFVSLSSVKKHVCAIYRKLGIKNNRELMLMVYKAKDP